MKKFLSNKVAQLAFATCFFATNALAQSAQIGGNGSSGVTGVAQTSQSIVQTLVVATMNISELVFVAWMGANVLVGIALERQGHKEVVKDIMVGSCLICLPTVINTLLRALAGNAFSGGGALWF